MEINILGSGIMGAQIVALFRVMGYKVNIWDAYEIDLKKIERETKKLLKCYEIDSKLPEIVIIEKIEQLPNSITIEVIKEDLELKKLIYKKIRLNNNSLYFTNSSSFTPKEIAEDVCVLHFFNPISLNLVEYFLNDIQEEKIEWIELLENLKKLNYTAVKVKENRGFIGNYLLFMEISNYFKMIEVYGYNFTSLDQVYGVLYQDRNIVKIVDLIGIDVVLKILHNLNEQDNSIYVPQILKNAINMGILGRKNKTTIQTALF